MEEKTNRASSKSDIIFWAIIILLVGAGVFASYHFRELAWAIRLSFWIVFAVVLLGLVSLTTQGKKLWVFVKSARVELYKVVWPTRDETIKTTAVVASLVFAMSLILWLMDSFLLWIVGWFTR